MKIRKMARGGKVTPIDVERSMKKPFDNPTNKIHSSSMHTQLKDLAKNVGKIPGYSKGTKSVKKYSKGGKVKKYQIGSKGVGYYTGTEDNTAPISVKRKRTGTSEMLEDIQGALGLGMSLASLGKGLTGMKGETSVTTPSSSGTATKNVKTPVDSTAKKMPSLPNVENLGTGAGNRMARNVALSETSPVKSTKELPTATQPQTPTKANTGSGIFQKSMGANALRDRQNRLNLDLEIPVMKKGTKKVKKKATAKLK